MTDTNLLAENLKASFGDAFVDARPHGGRAYILAFLGNGTAEEFFADNKSAIVDAFRKSGAAESISEPRPSISSPAGSAFWFTSTPHR